MDRSRVRIAHADARDVRGTRAAIVAFAADLKQLDAPSAEASLDVDTECDPIELEPKR